MTLRNHLLTALMATVTAAAPAQEPAVHFDMSLHDGSITELLSGTSYPVASKQPACSSEGVSGEALRFDGYSNYVKAGIAPGTAFEDIPDDWVCPWCGLGKDAFEVAE